MSPTIHHRSTGFAIISVLCLNPMQHHQVSAFTVPGHASKQMSYHHTSNRNSNRDRQSSRRRKQRRDRRGSQQQQEDDDGNNFARRMRAQEDIVDDGHEDSNDNQTTMDESSSSESALQQRRRFLHAVITATSTVAVSSSSASSSLALQQTFPSDLDVEDESSIRDLGALRSSATVVTPKKIAGTTLPALDPQTKLLTPNNTNTRRRRREGRKSPTDVIPIKDGVGSIVWAGALWLLSGSRSNPIVTPLADLLYDDDDDEQKQPQWLKDRKDGLFSPLPPGFLFLLGMVFLMLGTISDRTLLFLVDGDRSTTLQLGGVSLITGGSIELARIYGGEKKQTRQESERNIMLRDEFEEFALRRLKRGGNVHKSEVVGAFRRFYGKYRVENEEYPLNDMEIERLMREWNRERGYVDVSSGGFYKGIQIDDQADVFVGR